MTCLFPIRILPMRSNWFTPHAAWRARLPTSTICVPSCVNEALSVPSEQHDTPALFDWLIETLSFQGISNAIASNYMAQHGTIRWSEIADALSQAPSCPKLGGYWRFHDCQYTKGVNSCSEPSHIDACPLPRHPLRNGRLNQMAYSLFLFMRDIMDGDFVAWIDQQLVGVDPQSPDRLSELREAVVGPLRNVYGVADKVLAIALSPLLMALGKRKPLWFEVGASLVAVDTLVHNFLHRTGILQRFCARARLRRQLLSTGRMRHRLSGGLRRTSTPESSIRLFRRRSSFRSACDLALLRRGGP